MRENGNLNKDERISKSNKDERISIKKLNVISCLWGWVIWWGHNANSSLLINLEIYTLL